MDVRVDVRYVGVKHGVRRVIGSLHLCVLASFGGRRWGRRVCWAGRAGGVQRHSIVADHSRFAARFILAWDSPPQKARQFRERELIHIALELNHRIEWYPIMVPAPGIKFRMI